MKRARLNRLPYHSRRVLGQLVRAGNNGIHLDEFDKRYALELVNRGWVREIGYRYYATTYGEEIWREFQNQNLK